MRNKTKYLIGIFVFSMILLNLSNYGNSTTDFSQYLENSVLQLNKDAGFLFQQEASEENAFRNIFSTISFPFEDPHLYYLGNFLNIYDNIGHDQFYFNEAIKDNHSFGIWKEYVEGEASYHEIERTFGLNNVKNIGDIDNALCTVIETDYTCFLENISLYLLEFGAQNIELTLEIWTSESNEPDSFYSSFYVDTIEASYNGWHTFGTFEHVLLDSDETENNKWFVVVYESSGEGDCWWWYKAEDNYEDYYKEGGNWILYSDLDLDIYYSLNYPEGSFYQYRNTYGYIFIQQAIVITDTVDNLRSMIYSDIYIFKDTYYFRIREYDENVEKINDFCTENQTFNHEWSDNLEVNFQYRLGKCLNGTTDKNGNYLPTLEYTVYVNKILNYTGYYESINYQSTQETIGTRIYSGFNNILSWYIEAKPYEANGIEYQRNALRGVRCIRAIDTGYYHNFLPIPRFYDSLDLYDPTFQEESEIEEYLYYWSYISIKIAFDEYDSRTAGNWSYDYPLLTTSSVAAKYPYNYETWDYWDYKDWYNVLENLVIGVINIIIWLGNMIVLFFQGIGYLATLVWNYLILYLIVGMIFGFIWNFLLNALLWSIIYLGWWVFYLFAFIWNEILVPFFEWFVDVGIPLMLTILIAFLSFLIALLLWGFTLLQADFDMLYENVNSMITTIVNEILEWINIFVIYFPYFIAWIFVYVILIGVIYLKYLYFKSKGWHDNAAEMKELYTTFLKPFTAVFNLYARLRGSKSSD